MREQRLARDHRRVVARVRVLGAVPARVVALRREQELQALLHELVRVARAEGAQALDELADEVDVAVLDVQRQVLEDLHVERPPSISRRTKRSWTVPRTPFAPFC